MNRQKPRIVVGCDPGITNFAIAKIKVWPTAKFQVLHAGMIEKAPRQLKHNVHSQLVEFQNEVCSITKQYPVAIERFMARGLRNNTGEIVAMLVGIVALTNRSKLLTAASWKNAANRVFDLNLLYKSIGVPPHVVDASMIAIYAGQLQFDSVSRFQYWSYETAMSLKSQLEKSWSKTNKVRSIKNEPEVLKMLRKSF